MKHFKQLVHICKNALKSPVKIETKEPRKFTVAEAYAIIAIAEEERRRSFNALRWGQAVWNVAYDKNPELMDFYRAGSKDFFHVRDLYKAEEMFNEYYVEK